MRGSEMFFFLSKYLQRAVTIIGFLFRWQYTLNFFFFNSFNGYGVNNLMVLEFLVLSHDSIWLCFLVIFQNVK